MFIRDKRLAQPRIILGDINNRNKTKEQNCKKMFANLA